MLRDLHPEFWEGTLETGLKRAPVRRCAHEHPDGGDVLIQLDVAGVWSEALVMPPLAIKRPSTNQTRQLLGSVRTYKEKEPFHAALNSN